MAEYGSGVSFSRACMLNKERIQHALRQELVCDETENGFVYTPCTETEAEQYILSAYDEAVYQAHQALHAGRALEYILRQHGIEPNLNEYMDAMVKTARLETYQYEVSDEEMIGAL